MTEVSHRAERKQVIAIKWWTFAAVNQLLLLNCFAYIFHHKILDKEYISSKLHRQIVVNTGHIYSYIYH